MWWRIKCVKFWLCCVVGLQSAQDVLFWKSIRCFMPFHCATFHLLCADWHACCRSTDLAQNQSAVIAAQCSRIGFESDLVWTCSKSSTLVNTNLTQSRRCSCSRHTAGPYCMLGNTWLSADLTAEWFRCWINYMVFNRNVSFRWVGEISMWCVWCWRFIVLAD